MKKLLIDAGNSRIKWAVIQHDQWLQRGAMPLEKLPMLASQITDMQGIFQVWVSNVAGEGVAARIKELGIHDTRFISAQRSGYGIENGYADPAQLGSDRWAALISAWNIVGRQCIVVNSGTATTIDTLSESGKFRGGLILPGIELMQRSLVHTAANLRAGGGRYQHFPDDTCDGMFSGAIQATCGAIERQQRSLGSDDVPIILGGGAAQQLLPHLGMQVELVEDMVLRGISLIAREEKTK
ncbi:MAG TPA: type III pantothenate kinase [Gallionella sp.]